jgi:hypothetical protein
VLFDPEVVYEKLSQYQESERNTANVIVPEAPKTQTTPNPFQRPLTSTSRPTHLKYLDQCLDDRINLGIEFTPSFIRSSRACQSTTEPKILKYILIQEREINQAKADIQGRRRKDQVRRYSLMGLLQRVWESTKFSTRRRPLGLNRTRLVI